MRLSQRILAFLTDLSPADTTDLWVIGSSGYGDLAPGLAGVHVPDAGAVIDGAVGSAIIIRDRLPFDELLATAVHEFAHTITEPRIRFQAIGPEDVRCAIASGEFDCRVGSTLPPWHGHELAFLRTCCHLLHRAHLAGHNVDPAAVVDHERYQLSPLAEYRAALGLEPECWTSHAIRTVLQSPPPAAFSALWQRDVRHNERNRSCFTTSHPAA